MSWRAAIAVCIALIGAVSCAAPRQSPANLHTGSIRVGISGEPDGLDPVLDVSRLDADVENLIFDSLLSYDAKTGLHPDLALAVPSRANGGISPDGKTITYRLRRNVEWQDGAPFTAADVAFTYHLMIDRRVGSPYAELYGQIAQLETPDPYTVVIRLRKRSSSILELVFDGGGEGIVPKHILARDGNLARSAFNSAPIGTGPYRLVAWSHGERLTLERNSRYFDSAPKVNTLVLVPDVTPGTAAVMLRSGEIDIAQLDGPSARTLNGRAGLMVRSALAPSLIYVVFNMRRSPFSDRSLRAAAMESIDGAQLASRTDAAVAATSPLYPNSWAHDDGKPCIAYDRADAHRRLEHTARAFRLSYPRGYPNVDRVVLQLQQEWSAAGMHVSLHAIPDRLYWSTRGPLQSGTFDAAIVLMGIDAPDVLQQLFASDAIPPAGYNYGAFRDAQTDAALAAADTDFDPAARAADFQRVRRRLCDELAIMPLLWSERTYGVNERIAGFPWSDDILDDATQWHFNDEAGR